MAHVAWQYLVFIFVSCVGVLQAAAAYSGLKGLLLIPRRLPSFGLAAVLVIGAFVWFFRVDDRAPAAGWPILEGGPQTLLFTAGAGLALGFTALLTSMLRVAADQRSSLKEEGLEALREEGYLQALLRRWRRG
ncbi:MAG: hypothetical protein HYY01_11945 [Chloroflexi bacterium]|nr:hypothetical protein [Chloroflexota bacterium]